MGVLMLLPAASLISAQLEAAGAGGAARPGGRGRRGRGLRRRLDAVHRRRSWPAILAIAGSQGGAADGALLLFVHTGWGWACRSSPPGSGCPPCCGHHPWLRDHWARSRACRAHVLIVAGVLLASGRLTDLDRPAGRIASMPREGRLGGRQPAPVHQGGAAVSGALAGRAITCWCTPASTTTTSCRRCSSRSWGWSRPTTASTTGSGSHAQQTGGDAGRAGAGAGGRARRTWCWSTATPTRRWPGRWWRPSSLPAGPRRVGAALVRPGDAGGGQPGGRPTSSPTCASAPARRRSTTSPPRASPTACTWSAT